MRQDSCPSTDLLVLLQLLFCDLAMLHQLAGSHRLQLGAGQLLLLGGAGHLEHLSHCLRLLLPLDLHLRGE